MRVPRTSSEGRWRVGPRAVGLAVLVVVAAVATLVAPAVLLGADDVVGWTREFGTTADDYVQGVAVDALGNVYVCGSVQGTLAAEPYLGAKDAFLRKYTADGAIIWTKQFRTTLNDEAFGVAVDAAGDVYVAGQTEGALPAGGGSQGGFDAFLRKYSSDGNTVYWTRQFGTGAYDGAIAVSVDASGNAWLGGGTSGALPGFSNVGNADLFVRRYDPSGLVAWTDQTGTAQNDFAFDIASSTADAVMLAARTDGGTFPGQSSAGYVDAVVVLYRNATSPSPAVGWAHQFGTGGIDQASGVAGAAGGDFIVTGYVQGQLPGQPYAGQYDAFVRRYTGNASSPQVTWTQQFGTSGWEFGDAISTDAQGAVYVSGSTTGTLAGAGNAGTYDAFVSKWTAGGASPTWVDQFGTSGDDNILGSAVDVLGDLYVGGIGSGAIGGQPYLGGKDALVRKYVAPAVSQVATPTFNPDGGSYVSTQTVTMTCATPGATIRYTTNGSDPTASSATYSTPVTIAATTTLKARAFKAGMLDSAVKSAVYTISISADTVGPIAAVAAPALSTQVSARATFPVSWSATDPAPGSGVASYDVQYKIGRSGAWTDWRMGTTATSATFTGRAGKTYYIHVRAKDDATNVGGWAVSSGTVVPFDESAMRFRGSWARRGAGRLYFGKSRHSGSRGAYATLRFASATQVGLVITTQKIGGYADVYIGARRVKRVNTYSPTTKYRRYVVVRTSSTRMSGTLKVVVLRRKAPAAKGYRVELDGVAVRN